MFKRTRKKFRGAATKVLKFFRRTKATPKPTIKKNFGKDKAKLKIKKPKVSAIKKPRGRPKKVVTVFHPKKPRGRPKKIVTVFQPKRPRGRPLKPIVIEEENGGGIPLPPPPPEREPIIDINSNQLWDMFLTDEKYDFLRYLILRYPERMPEGERGAAGQGFSADFPQLFYSKYGKYEETY